jgi:hypothetical protein
MQFPDSYCRKCNGKNHVVFFAPVFVVGLDCRDSTPHATGVGTHICLDCAIKAGFADRQGNLKPGVVL